MNRIDKRIRIRNDVYDSMTYYIHDKKTELSGVPGVMPDMACVVNEILINFLSSQGHYPPKVKAP
jgi:hypothetical protein